MVGAAAIGGAVLVAVALVAVALRPTTAPESSPSAPAQRPFSGVVAYYEVMTGRGVTLYERRLDGISLPRAVAQQTGASYGRTFSVSPDGRWALAFLPTQGQDGGLDVTVARIDIATGDRTELGTIDGVAIQGLGIWSADGAAWANTALDADGDRLGTAVVDVAAGRLTVIKDTRGRPYAFEGPTRLLLYEERGPVDAPQDWAFQRIDVSSGESAQVGLAALPPLPGAFAPVSLATGQGVLLAHERDAAEQDHVIVRLRDLRRGTVRDLVTLDALERAVLTPSGDAIVGCNDDAVLLIAFDGTSRTALQADGIDCFDDGFLSARGGLAAVGAWDEGSILRLLDTATGQILRLPLANVDRNAEAHLAGIVGESLVGAALPPVADPGPTPVPHDAQPVAGAPLLPRIVVETNAAGVPVVRAERVTAGVNGGMAVVSTMAPIQLPRAMGIADQPWVEPLRSAAGEDILLVINWEGAGEFWMWHADGSRDRLTVPDGFPLFSDGWALSPDGTRLAAATFDQAVTLVTWELATGSTHAVRLHSAYGRVEGWPRDDAVLVGHGICTEGCPGRYAYSRVVDPTTGKLYPIDATGTSAGIGLHFMNFEPHRILPDAINEEDSDDLEIPWPKELPAIRRVIVRGDDLIVVAGEPARGLQVLRLDDGYRRALDGRQQAAPVRLGTLPTGAEFGWLSDDGRWALTEELYDFGALVDLTTGAEYAIEPGIRA
jgi:hypothetical protein